MPLSDTPLERAEVDRLRESLPANWIVARAERTPGGIEVTLEALRPQPTPLRHFLIRADGTSITR